MNRRAAWVLSAMAAVVISVAVLTVAGGGGFGGGGADIAQRAAAQALSDTARDAQRSQGANDDHDEGGVEDAGEEEDD